MAITPDYVREVFKGLETSDGAAFFKQVADGVDWTVMGTHPLAGRYRSKRAFQEATFGKLGKVLPKGTQLRVTNVIVAADMAVQGAGILCAQNMMQWPDRMVVMADVAHILF